MRLLTRKGQAEATAVRWKEQYCHGGTWSLSGHADGTEGSESTYRCLLEMERTPERVESFLNSSWVMVYCDECGAKPEAVVELGDEPDYGSSTARVCLPCIQKAVALLAAPEKPAC